MQNNSYDEEHDCYSGVYEKEWCTVFVATASFIGVGVFN